MRPSFSLPPEEYCLGTRPSQAASWRAELGDIADRCHQRSGGEHTDPGNGLQALAGLIAFVPFIKLSFQRPDPGLRRLQLFCQQTQGVARRFWQSGIFRDLDDCDKLAHLRGACANHQGELTAMAPDRIGQHCLLAHQQLPGAMQGQN